MRPSRFTKGQIIRMRKEQEAGAATADVCRKHGISSATFYKFIPTMSTGTLTVRPTSDPRV